MSIIDMCKNAYQLAQKYGQQDLYQLIVDLREEAFKLSEENLILKQQLLELRKTDDIQSKLKRNNSNQYVWKEGSENSDQPGPFCIACWDFRGKLVNLYRRSLNGHPYWSCEICTQERIKK